MREINSVEEIQNISFELLSKFHDFCEENHLRYILAAGTLLGAIRHHDFIPWDDDIDVQMPRPDYERFIELSKNGIGDNAKVVCWKYMEHPYFAFTKVIDTRTVLKETISIPNEIGIYIDVFPTDGLPNSREEIEKKFKRIKRYKDLLIVRVLKIQKGKTAFSLLKKALIVPIIRLLYDPQKLIERINEIALEDPFEQCDKVAFQVRGYNIKEVTEREKFYTRKLVGFRDKDFYVPSNYDEYLRSLFGDYMQLPPIDQRVTHHDFIAYWRGKE